MKKKRVRRRKTYLIRKKRLNRIFFLLILLVILIYITPKFVSTAKFVYNMVREYYLSSKDFYFSSDKLSLNHTEYEITNNWSGAETYVVTINLSSKKNDMAFTESDINYQVTFTKSDNIACTLSKSSGTIVGSDNNGVNEDYFLININPVQGTTLGEGETAWVDVTVTSTSPYSQTLSGRLKLEVGSADVTYEIIDAVNQPYLTVNITNSQSVGANVTLHYNPQVLLLDMTDRFYINASDSTSQQLNNYTYLNSITSYVDSLSTTKVKFYKIDATQNYSFNSMSTGIPAITLTR